MLPDVYGAIESCVWKPHTALTSLRHPLLFLSFLCHPYILTIFLENFYSFLILYGLSKQVVTSMIMRITKVRYKHETLEVAELPILGT